MRALILRSSLVGLVGLSGVLLLLLALRDALPFAAQLTYYNGDNGDYDIFLVDVSRALTVMLTRNPEEDTRPAWSPDGQQLVFYSHRNHRTDLYMMNGDGSQQHRLTDSGGPGAYPDWSPDGQWIVFASLQAAAGGIYRIRPDGSDVQRLTDLRAAQLIWSPDSQRILFTADCDNNCDLYVMNGDGSQVRRLTHTGEFDVYPVWSPDSQRIAFMSNRDGNLEIYVMEADCDETARYTGCDAYRLTHNRGFDGFPDWSPDGKWITFTGDRDGNAEIYSLSADCYRQAQTCPPGTRLTNRLASDIESVWSPDGRQIAVISSVDIDVMNADGSGLRRLAYDVLRDQLLTWRPHN